MAKSSKKVAKRGWLYAEGETMAEAKKNLEAMIDWSCENGATQIESRYGLLIIVSCNASGFWHTIVNPADMAHGKAFHSSCHYGQISYIEALNFARSHACQYAWHYGINSDAEHIAAAQVTPDKARELQHLFDCYRAQRPANMGVAA
jgi:hypothetical protein